MRWATIPALALGVIAGCASAFDGDEGTRADLGTAPTTEEVPVVGICVQTREDGSVAVSVYAEAFAGADSYRCELSPGERGLEATALAVMGGGSTTTALCGAGGPWTGPIECEGDVPLPSLDRPYLFVKPAGTSAYDYRYPTESEGTQCVSWPYLDFEDREGLEQLGCVSDRPCGQPLTWVRGCEGTTCRMSPLVEGVRVSAGSEGCGSSYGRVFCLGSEQDAEAYRVMLGGELVGWDGTDVCIPNP